MKMDEMILVSVDDHLVEPDDVFVRHTPAKYKGRFPHLVTQNDGTDVWEFDGRVMPNIGINAVAGRRPEEYGVEPTSLKQLRKGCYDVHARIDDMNVNGVLGSLCFPSFIGTANQFVMGSEDKALALAVTQAWNDWNIEDWAGAYPGRLMSMAALPLWDAEASATEVRRVARKGCHTVTIMPNPTVNGLPSIHSDYWNPVWGACRDENVTISMHISDPAGVVPSLDSPVDVLFTNMPLSLAAASSDLVFSPVLRKFPGLKFAMSEGGSGWVPFMLRRMDFTWWRHKWTRQDFSNKLPSELFLEHIYTCFIDDPSAIESRHVAGINNLTWECDYPHSDGCWPESPETIWKSLKDVPKAEIDKITHLNAMRLYSFDPFKYLPREESTVGALRAKAKHVDTSYTETKGAGKKITDRDAGPITMRDLAKQLEAMTPIKVSARIGN